MALFLACVANAPVSRVNSHPAHSSKFVINHEAQCIWHIRFIGHTAETVFVANRHAFLHELAQARHELGMRAVNFEELLFFLLVIHNRELFYNFDLQYGISCKHCFVEL